MGANNIAKIGLKVLSPSMEATKASLFLYVEDKL